MQEKSRKKWTLSRSFLSALAVLALGIAGVVGLSLALHGNRATREMYEQIEMGMTKADVIAIIGTQPNEPDNPPHWDLAMWNGPRHTRLYVRFDMETGLVSQKQWDYSDERSVMGTFWHILSGD